jgi:hypothetical protein
LAWSAGGAAQDRGAKRGPALFARRSMSTPLAKISGQFGFAITTDLDAVLADASVDLVDICRCRTVLLFSAVVLLLA